MTYTKTIPQFSYNPPKVLLPNHPPPTIWYSEVVTGYDRTILWHLFTSILKISTFLAQTDTD